MLELYIAVSQKGHAVPGDPQDLLLKPQASHDSKDSISYSDDRGSDGTHTACHSFYVSPMAKA
jgi:hypothetical protein